MEDDLQFKMTSIRREPPRDDNLKGKTTSKGRQPQMEDNLHWNMTSNGRQMTSNEDNLQLKQKWDNSTTIVWISTCMFLGGN